MTEDKAKQIVRWMTEEPKSILDYGTSFTASEIVEAYRCMDQALPDWVCQILGLPTMDSVPPPQ